MGDQLRDVFVAHLGKMHFVPHPQRRAFLPITSIKIIWGIDQLGCGQSRFNSPLPALLDWLKLLFPDAPERRDGRQGFHPVRCAGSIQGVEEDPPIHSHLISIVLAFVIALGQALMIKPLPIAFDPFHGHIGANPLRGDLRQDVQHRDHRLSNAQHAIEGADLGQDMGGTGRVAVLRL